MKWHEVVEHKHVFSDFVKHVWTHGGIEPHNISRNASSHTDAAAMDLSRRSQWEILEHPP